MNKKIKILITIAIIILIGTIAFWYFDLGPPWGLTEEDISKMNKRWWVIYYKIIEDEIPGQTTELVARPDGVDGILDDEFGIDFLEMWNDPNTSIKDKYRYAKRRNELMEEALAKFRGAEALKEIEGIWSLDEIPDLYKKVNNI